MFQSPSLCSPERLTPAMNRISYTSKSRTSKHGPARPKSKEENEKSMWSSILDSVPTSKRLPEKNLLVLGGSSQTQKNFLDTLASDVPKKNQDRYKKRPPIANAFALGYTYQDVLDADHEDTLARLSIYLMSDSSPVYAPLLKPLLTPGFMSESLVVVLLDWNEPWSWLKQLRRWIAMLLDVIKTLDKEADAISERVMQEWQQKKRGNTSYDLMNASSSNESHVVLPLGEGEWDLPLGLPLCVVCHNSDRIASLEVEHGWREEDFDFVLQSLRTVLLRHGASLIYTSNSIPNALPSLIHSSLGICSSLKKQTVKHNVIDREKILVPPNWDSFGKIRVLREGFDVEEISELWSTDLRTEASMFPSNNQSADMGSQESSKEQENSVLKIYSSTITDPSRDRSLNDNTKAKIEITVPSYQEFLSTQLEVIERLKLEEAKTGNDVSSSRGASNSAQDRDRIMNDQIGPIQVNMGGIQVDAGDALRRLKSGWSGVDSSSRGPLSPFTAGASTKSVVTGDGASVDPGTPSSAMATPEREMKAQNEALNNFFTGLMKRGASGSPRSTPGAEGGRRGTPKDKTKEDGGGRRLFGKE